jgi:FimV-like protein
VGLEVQRVRKALQQRRELRSLSSPPAHAQIPAQVQEQAAAMPEQTCAVEPAEITKPVPPDELQEEQDLALSYVQEPADHFSPSVRVMSDAETRLALAREFEKLGQMDEAAQLCEEVIASGSDEERKRAQKYLHQLPGR